jgi:hypothetical protein
MHIVGRSLSELGIAMVLIVELLKDVRFLAKGLQRSKPLTAEKGLVMRIVEAFHDAIAPWFSFRDKDNFDSCVEAKTEEQAKGARMPVRAPEGEFIVQLEEAWKPQASPLAKKCLANGLCLL